MEVFRSLTSYKKGKNTIVTIGTFDGVHVGHTYILKQIISKAKAKQGESLLISFDPHPRMILRPEDNSLRLLHTIDEKIRLLESLGLDKLLLIPFSRDFSLLSSDEYIERVLLETVNPSEVVIGYDHRFGHDRKGGISELQKYALEHNFEVQEIPAQAVDDAKVSSTKIREALKNGDVSSANKYLGYNYSFGGTVIHGEKMGRKLGFPTANIQPDSRHKLIPANGVYLVKVHLKQGSYYGLMNIGNKPTVGEFARGFEVYILNFDDDIYGEYLRTEFLERRRSEKKFGSLDALIEAMNADKAYALQRIEELEN
ncbi:MAG: bifunctional riboflavin kinase/FAD synthetase [Bacteroidia bacterium]|nr:bifunctional riboflavin kinase/FAD synthetase [Bacteroidia bacterium]